MQKNVAKWLIVAVIGLAVGTMSLALFERISEARVAAAVRSTSDDGQAAADGLTDRFKGQGAWVAMNALGQKSPIAATEEGGVMLTIFGLAAVAVVARMRWQAETAASRAGRRP